jgi:hypothetical protein
MPTHRLFSLPAASPILLTLFVLLMAGTSVQAAPTANVEDEIEQYYADAGAEVIEYIRWTAKNFAGGGLWLPENAFDDLSAEEREAKIVHYVEALQGEYGRHLCTAIVESGVLKDARLYPGVLKVATFHRDDSDYDCRPKWMAVQALGRLGNEAAIPALIPLVDHGNQNTRMWARASLVRLTDQNFGADKAAWGAWWNSTGKSPQLSEADLKPWQPIDEVEQGAGVAATAPELVSVSPEIGAREVDPATSEIRVTFDQDMRGGFSWTGGGEVYPEVNGKAKWIDKRNCVLRVKLSPARFYRVGINSTSHKGFCGVNGIPARVRTLYFTTAGAGAATLARLEPPQVLSLDPPNGAATVDPATNSLTVTFNKPMGGGFSWVTIDDHYPPTTGGASWNEDHTVCTMPVALAPGTLYRLSLNAPGYTNFNSESGVPLDPVVWEFTTASE